MGQDYQHFSLDERCEVARLQAEGHSIRQIAAALDRAPSSVARELKRNTISQNNGYKPAQAMDQARARRWKGSKLDRQQSLRQTVLKSLGHGLSPEQIAGRMALEQGHPVISHETIYRFIYAQITRHNDYSWRKYLPRAKAKRGWRGHRGGSPANFIHNRVSITCRTQNADDRANPGHWEADLMLFAKYGQTVLTLHDRTSRILIGQRPPNKTAPLIAASLKSLLQCLPQPLRQTITFDNGTEFAHHSQLHDLNISTYFCDTYSPWQKGGVENAIGRMRRLLPRKTDLAQLSDEQFNTLIAIYNNTPRKCLDFKTPTEVFLAQLLHFECESTHCLPLE
jgi:transposase, IS30 family